jgi:DNA (cytosine-5)-methyltransferase 1
MSYGMTIESEASGGNDVGSIDLFCLDLFCCQGGAGMGYSQAGMQVHGVDIEPQPKYPFDFTQGDALEYLREHGHKFDLIHASPPCQGYSHLTPAEHKGKYPKLIPELRQILKDMGKPYVIENVQGAKNELEKPIMLCGLMFGLRTIRRRWFETSFDLVQPDAKKMEEIPLLVTTASKASRAKRKALGMKPKTVKNAPLAYGIDWMTFDGLKECIPPAYTRWIAEQFILQNS